MKTYQFIGLLFFYASHVTAFKVIVVQQNMNSHIIYHARIAHLLADEGHQVDMLLPSNAMVPATMNDTKVNFLRHKVKDSVPFANTEQVSNMIVDYIMAETLFKKQKALVNLMFAMLTKWEEDCQSLLADEDLMKKLAEKEYDVAIADLASINCHIPLLYEMDVPVIFYGILSVDWMFRVPILPSFVPSLTVTFADSMSFVDRLLNTLNYFFSHIVYVLLDVTKVGVAHQTLPTAEVFNRSALCFALDDVSIAYPRPTMPNVVYVGDSVPQPGKPLPPHLAQFVDGAPDGVVIVSFGSYFDYIPSEVAGKLCSAFKRIPQKVIWKLKNKTLCDADRSKVLTLDWLPQNDLLSQHNVKLFISHCGMNSMLESIYHSTPIIAFPGGLDQPYNARRLANRGLGYEMNMRDFTVEELVDKIAQILEDETVLDNVQRASAMMREKPDRPEKRITYWLEHVVKYGSGHLKSKAFELNTFQFYCLDVLLVILCILALIVVMLICCLRAVILKVKRCFDGKRKLD